MMHHYSQYVISNGISHAVPYQLLSTQGGYLGVAIFFFLSGYGLMESEQKSHLNLKSFIIRRFIKIYLPVLSVTFIWMIASSFLLDKSPFSGFELLISNNHRLIIGNIFLNFGDEVLWFIRALFILYTIFYLFSIVWQLNWQWALIFIGVMTTAATIYNGSISIPYFALGVVMSVYKNQGERILIVCISALICFAAFGFLFWETNIAAHSAINAMLIGILIWLLSILTMEIKFPALLGVMSFDLYLTHNKVLQTLKYHYSDVSLCLFITTTLLFTTAFYLFRSRFLKI